jgi:carboxyl-terminal processing protease
MRHTLIILFGCLIGISALGQGAPDYRKEAILLRKAFTKYHFQPNAIDDEFSRHVYATFMESVDGARLCFTVAEVKQLESFQNKLDDELNGESWNFLKVATPLVKKVLERAEGIIRKQSEVPFAMLSNDVYKHDTLHWANDENELALRWRGWLHFQTLDQLAYRKEAIPGDGHEYFTKHEPIVRARVAASEIRSFERVLQHSAGFENYLASLYFQSVTTVFDAHSVYMGLTDMENFLSAQSTEGYYFGISIDENDHGATVITSVTPGSPAWKSGVIEVGDEVISVRRENQTGDMSGLSIDEVNQLLSDANHALVEFKLRNPVGLEKTVMLQKEKISMEQNFVRSYLLIGADGKRIGYIYLPHFYTQWDEESEGSRCANDVAMEVIKLSKEKIDGIILDVRDNAGGSLAEAAAMAGIFIDEGPLAIIRNNTQALNLYKDTFRGTIFDGPLILMVNNQSASASEFLAAALQDYKRAVIVGSRTFGKATAQRLFPLDPNQPEPSLSAVKTGTGYATITVEKIYRVTGKTAQHIGVVPDVDLPFIRHGGLIRESQMPFALRADSVQRKTYYKPLSALPTEDLRKRSATRVAANKRFALITTTDEWLSKTEGADVSPVSLNWDRFLKQSSEDMSRLKAFENVFNDSTAAFEVRSDPRDSYRMELDEFAKTYNEQWVKKLKSDIYVEEVFHIMNDLVTLTSGKK